MASKVNYQIETVRELTCIAQRGETGGHFEIVNLHKREPLVLPERSMETVLVEEAGNGGQNQLPD